MRIPQDENKTVSSADATVAMRLDATGNNGSREVTITNKTGDDLLVWRTDSTNTPTDGSVTNADVKANWTILIPDKKTIVDNADVDIKYFGALNSGTGTVRVQEKTS